MSVLYDVTLEMSEDELFQVIKTGGAGITGELRGGDYLLAFRRPVGRARGPFSPQFRSRFTLLAPDLAMKRADVSLFGLPLGHLSAVHRRIGA